jgi:tRNA G18 (ribose-2'-O)-methylase SpoU
VGVTAIHLVGYTPHPLDRFGRERTDLAKVALGAEKNVPWEAHDSVLDVISNLKKSGFSIVALEQTDSSIDYKDYDPPEKFALILGNEPNGIPKEVLQLCDSRIEIPMNGEKESLNVGVAAGIALYRLLDV